MLYNSWRSEPYRGYDNNMKLYFYNGKLITSTYDSANTISSLLYSLYINNGTTAGSAPLYANVIKYMALSNGEIVAAMTNGGVYLLTQILNGSYAAGKIWSINPSCSGTGLAGLAVYGNVIAFGCGTNANVMGINSNYVASIPVGSALMGVSAYGGKIAYLSASNMLLINASGMKKWLVAIPSGSPSFGYGTAIANATPVISLQNVYSLWSNSWGVDRILVQNLTSGAVIADTVLPYSRSMDLYWSSPHSDNPYMALAYGRLFVSQGSYLMAFGTCPVDPNDSVLAAVGTLYINGMGSCAAYLLSQIQPGSNYSVLIQPMHSGTSPQYAASFSTGYARIIIPSLAALAIIGPGLPITITGWIRPSTCTYDGDPYGTIFYNTLGTGQRVLISSDCRIVFQLRPFDANPDTYFSKPLATSPSIPLNAWAFFAATYDPTANTLSMYVNGGTPNTVAGYTVTFGSMAMPAWIGYSGDAPYATNGLLANIQVYNVSLSSAQIQSLYRGGLNAPPVSYSNLAAWFPLEGDGNSYANTYAGGFPAGDPLGATFQPVVYNSTLLRNAYSITSQTVPLPLLNYTKGGYTMYDVGVYSWR